MEITDKRIKSLVGKKFGRWKVLEYDGVCKSGSKWMCICECGKKRSVIGSNLKKGLSTSCGCIMAEKSHKRMKDLTGKKFGKLTVEKYSHTKGKPHWFCACECGKEVVVNGGDLKLNKRISCGCSTECRTHGLSNNPKAYYKHRMQNPFIKLRSKVSIAVTKHLNKKGSIKEGSILNYLPYSIDQLKEHLETQFEPWMNWNNYGGRTNETRKTWWIDHIKPQSQFQYTSMTDDSFSKCWDLSNLRPLEKIANIKKGAKYVL